jgi:hypothetical protein
MAKATQEVRNDADAEDYVNPNPRTTIAMSIDENFETFLAVLLHATEDSALAARLYTKVGFEP